MAISATVVAPASKRPRARVARLQRIPQQSFGFLNKGALRGSSCRQALFSAHPAVIEPDDKETKETGTEITSRSVEVIYPSFNNAKAQDVWIFPAGERNDVVQHEESLGSLINAIPRRSVDGNGR